MHFKFYNQIFVALTSLMLVMKIIKSKSSFCISRCIEMLMGKRSFQIFLCINPLCKLSPLIIFFWMRYCIKKLFKPVSYRVCRRNENCKYKTKFNILCRLLNTNVKCNVWNDPSKRQQKNRTQKDLKLIRMEKNKGVWGRMIEKRWMRLRQIGTRCVENKK